MGEPTRTFSLPKWGITRWLVGPIQEVSDEIRHALIASLFGSLPIFIGGVANTVLVSAVIALRHPHPLFLVWVALEVVLCFSRTYVVLKAYRAAARGRETPTDLYFALALCWSLGVGFGTFISLTSGDWVAAALACLSAAAMMGGICFRNFAAPRLATGMLLLSFGPACLGAALSGEPIMLLTVIQIPFYLFSMRASVVRLNAMLVSTMRAERDNEYRALHDMLTGLSNRSGLAVAIEAKLDPVRRGRKRIALLYLDLDGFKPVNDTYGHAAGDRLLKMASARMKAMLRPGDLAARIGGDEFVVLADDVDRTKVLRLGDRLIDGIAAPYDLGDGISATIGISVGIALSPDHGEDFVALLSAADAALYNAKLMGKGCCCLALDLEKVA